VLSISNGGDQRTYREETSLEDSKDDAKGDQLVPLRDEAEANHGGSPKDGDGREECARSDLAQDDGGGRLQQDVGDEEDENDDRVAFSDELEVDAHSGDDCDTRVGAVHQRDAVHASECQDQASVDSPDDLLLLLRGEGIDGIVVDDVGVI
jgi:hypothetical protein